MRDGVDVGVGVEVEVGFGVRNAFASGGLASENRLVFLLFSVLVILLLFCAGLIKYWLAKKASVAAAVIIVACIYLLGFNYCI